jgi:hypothetical protein
LVVRVLDDGVTEVVEGLGLVVHLQVHEAQLLEDLVVEEVPRLTQMYFSE